MKTIPYSKFKHGQRVTCEIDGVKVEGKIGIDNEGYVYLCSNNGSLIGDDFRAFGYTNSFSFLRKNEDYFYGKTQYIKNLKFFPRTIDDLEEGDVVLNPYGGARKILGKCGEVYFLSLRDNFNSAGDAMTISDMKGYAYTLKQDIEEEEKKIDLRSPEAEKMRAEARSNRWEFVPKQIENFFVFNIMQKTAYEDIWTYHLNDVTNWNMGNFHRTKEEALAWGEKYARYFLTE